MEVLLKIGAYVITSRGEVGVIEDICMCDKCAERGFYEPQIKTIIGDGTIMCTDADWRSNFRSFYQIGDVVLGNVDNDDLLTEIFNCEDLLEETKNRLLILHEQQTILDKIKTENRYGSSNGSILHLLRNIERM